MKALLSAKLTKAEKYWILYDVGNSAFTLLISTIMPIYFNYLAESAGLSEVDYLAFWGYAASVSTPAGGVHRGRWPGRSPTGRTLKSRSL